MSVPCARYFAADWEASSFLEFFIDLQARVAEDPYTPAGRTLGRLRDHSRFALQMTLVRAVDSFFAYVAEAEQTARTARGGAPWESVIAGVGRPPAPFDGDALIRNERSLAYGNVRQLDRFFAQATNVHVFETADEIDRASRLVVLRNFIAHGRTFAADDLASLIDGAATVGGIGLKLSAVRDEFWSLRSWVARTDTALAAAWGIDRPITSGQLFETIARVARQDAEATAPQELESQGASE
jgi:hypothetical protein